MSRNAYVDLCLHIQALRRSSEALRTPLAPATGIAASIYTHQVANVVRVLTDLRVRHLLADEVGLGKTVQALMVLNALRIQRRSLRALVIVPDRLVPQWRDELMTRAHTTPYETASPGDGQYVRLAWEAQLKQTNETGAPKLALGDIDPTKYDILIVDELHRLTSDLQDRIVRVSADFEHILALTATPSFQSPARHAQLFALMEPERTQCARLEIIKSSPELSAEEDLSKWPEAAAQMVVNTFLNRDSEAAGPLEEEFLSIAAITHCAYRRVIRTRRIDYSGVLPRRQHWPLIVEPLGAEIDRQLLMWRYFSHLDQLTTRFDPVLLAKRVILSPPSLEQRVDFLRRKGHDREGLLEMAKPLVHRSKGDSRADELVDLLARLWARDPEERVLVAAQDNLTVDYLFDLVSARLPEIGPIDKRVTLLAARVRQGMETDAVEDLGAFGNETHENLEAFQIGDAQVLFAPEAAQVGLNLQCARVLVLYSVPWKPEEVEQWIGRLDRIGNEAAFSNDGAARTIDVYTIAQRGLVDEKVVNVLKKFHVFERTVNLDGDHLETVAQAIERAVLHSESTNWGALESQAESLADEDDVKELNSSLRPYLPWNVSWARIQRERLDALPPVAPVIGGISGQAPFGPRAWDRAFECMLKLLHRSGDYHLRRNTDPATNQRFSSIWYRFGDPEIYGYRQVLSKIVFGFGTDPTEDRSPRNAHAFITRRGDLGVRPRREVWMELENTRYRRPLRFLGFGDALHDELVSGWTETDLGDLAIDVVFPEDHSLWDHAQPGWYVLRQSVLDPSSAISPSDALENVTLAVSAASTRASTDQLPGMVSGFRRLAQCSLEADARFLRISLTAVVDLRARTLVGEEWHEVTEAGAALLVDPLAHSGKGVPLSASIERSVLVDAELGRLGASVKVGRDVWKSSLPGFNTELLARLEVIRVEALDAIDLTGKRLEAAEAAVVDAETRGNKPQITRAINLRDIASDLLDMTKVFWNFRQAWLAECAVEIPKLQPKETFNAAIRARRFVK